MDYPESNNGIPAAQPLRTMVRPDPNRGSANGRTTGNGPGRSTPESRKIGPGYG